MAEVKIKPLGDRVIVKPIERETMKGGIIIPDTAKEKPMEGEVLAVGPGKLNDKGERAPMDVKKATACSTANIPARKSNWTMKTI